METAAMKLKDTYSLEGNLDSILKKDITLLTKIHIVKAMVFPVVMYGPKRRLTPEELMLSKCVLESPLDCKESKPVNPKENQP